MGWDEMRYAKVQEAFDHIVLDGRKVTLEDGAFTLMAAYLLGALQGSQGLVSQEDLDRLDLDENWWYYTENTE